MLTVRTTEGLADITPGDWAQLSNNPFLSYAFMAGLEQHDCLQPHGWYPHHLLVERAGTLVGALPLYIKTNSYGEFVFDWSWAEAYQRAGISYYPKLVTAVPYTPSVGPRLLTAATLADDERTEVCTTLIKAARALLEEKEFSSWHCLFPDADDMTLLVQAHLLERHGCQFHWYNRGYRDFQDFLDNLTSKRRKEVKRERRSIADAGVDIRVLTGAEAQDTHWQVFYNYYCSTFARKWGEPRLTLEFFKHLATELPASTLLILASRHGRYVAGAFAMRDKDTLYGRHWGCSEEIPYLHFEVCYYQTIDYCIEQRLEHLDAGAQGEHKLARGFEPVLTRSSHCMRDSRFARAVEAFLGVERTQLASYVESLQTHSAYHHIA